jgi:hypothetical protein
MLLLELGRRGIERLKAELRQVPLPTLSSQSRSQKGMDSMVICCQLAHTKKGT